MVAVLLWFNSARCQNSIISTMGTEFWYAYMDHADPPGKVFSPIGSHFMAYYNGYYRDTVNIIIPYTPGYEAWYITPGTPGVEAQSIGSYLGDKVGVQSQAIVARSRNPVLGYLHLLSDSSSAMTVILPVSTWGYDYYSINYTQQSNITKPTYSSIVVIGAENNTTIEITPTAQLIDGTPANVPFNITLLTGQVYQVLSTNDLTGTRIRSIDNGTGCKKIAVFAGSTGLFIGKPNVTSDNLFQQAYPTSSWGYNYVTLPFQGRNYDIYRIAVTDPATKVTVNGSVLPPNKLINNFYYEFNSQSINNISADKAIQVVQYSPSQGNDINGYNISNDVGDPDMVFLNSLEKTTAHTIVYYQDKASHTINYLNLVMPATGVPSFKINGFSYSKYFAPVPGNPSFSYAQIQLNAGLSYKLDADTGFNAIVYSFGDHDSYAYSAGYSYVDATKFVQFVKPGTKQVVSQGCTGIAAEPQVVLPYQTKSLTWDVGDKSAPVVQTNPVVKDTLHRNNIVVFVYDYGKLVSYPTAGSYPVKVTAVKQIGPSCTANEDITLNFKVFDPPVAKISSRDLVCLTDTLGFKDASITKATLSSWHWDFGNGDTSNVQNPVYTYKSIGTYTVSLVSAASGCSSNVFTKTIKVNPIAVAGFNYSNPNCENKIITFTDLSKIAGGKIVKRVWDFGDGTTAVTRTDSLPFNHVFTQAGSYTVTLTTFTASGCPGSANKTIKILASPTVGFALPDVCQADGPVSFTAIASISDNSLLTYTWDFGDVASAPANNTATGKVAIHQFLNQGVYNIRLTVTSANGCSKDTVKTIIVNGSSPKAAFTVLNAGTLCSNKAVQILNKASVNFGSITAVDMYYDYSNSPLVKSRYPYPSSGQILTHSYPQDTVDHQYKVLMYAYSGTLCVDSVSQVITVLGVPVVNFASASVVCLNAQPFQLVLSKKGPGGVAVFSGKGVSVSGWFDPVQAGIGAYMLQCIYTANNCSDTVSQQIVVEALPVVSTGANLYVLVGNAVKLRATASGSNLTYLWSPATGLSRADILDPTASPTSDTWYTLTVTSRNQNTPCSVTSTVKVTVLQPLVIPNTFTPNGDGVNDTWQIQYLDSYPGCTIDVFNRNGEKVFSSVGYAVPWDGRFNGLNLPMGAYYYIIDPKQGRSKIAGVVTIIR